MTYTLAIFEWGFDNKDRPPVAFVMLIVTGLKKLRSLLIRNLENAFSVGFLLQTQAAKCGYGTQLEDQLRDRLIAGIQLPELQQKLLLCPDQKFQTIRKMCEQYEDVKHHDFIVDTGSVESIIPQSDLTVFYPSAVIVPTDVNIRGITGHSVPLVGSCTIPVRLPQGTSIDCNFLVSTSGPSIIGLKVLRSLRTSITLLTSVDVNQPKQLILKCSKATGGMQIPKVKLEATGNPIFLKRRITPFGLREPVCQALNAIGEKGTLTPVESSNWATPIVTQPKADGITPRICVDYRLVLSTRLLQRKCITKEPEDVLYRSSDRLLIQPLPVKRDALVADTKRYFAPIFSALRRGWTQQERRRFPAFYCRRESLSVTHLPLCLDFAKTADVTFFKGNELRPATGIVLSSTGKRMVTILDLDDLSCHRRHIDQVEFNTKVRLVVLIYVRNPVLSVTKPDDVLSGRLCEELGRFMFFSFTAFRNALKAYVDNNYVISFRKFKVGSNWRPLQAAASVPPKKPTPQNSSQLVNDSRRKTRTKPTREILCEFLDPVYQSVNP
ncbi:hypothetical protein CLF_105391 [Clonorchis sinensis]|uniref:Gap-Pol polyprotein n=1 Tax=Clonorchis sinensis TaxID=79923 RepID=G7YP90_CLOSI|nr:hypothetical protein CLF_105391 [Clonorchis sinensis]